LSWSRERVFRSYLEQEMSMQEGVGAGREYAGGSWSRLGVYRRKLEQRGSIQE
jgi:hypothetical protein